MQTIVGWLGAMFADRDELMQVNLHKTRDFSWSLAPAFLVDRASANRLLGLYRQRISIDITTELDPEGTAVSTIHAVRLADTETT